MSKAVPRGSRQGRLVNMLGAVADRALDPEAVWGKFARDSPLEEAGFELVWGFSCQVVVFGL
jgi:hypothetical protein